MIKIIVLNWTNYISTESPDWLDLLLDPNAITVEEIKDALRRDVSTNLVHEYGRAQTLAGTYIDQGKEIPAILVEAIKMLANMDSGFTGMTVHESYLGFISHVN